MRVNETTETTDPDDPTPRRSSMQIHPVDPVALVAGLLFTFTGLAVIADRVWDGVDVTAITAAGVAVVGLLLAIVVVTRQLGGPDDPTGGDGTSDRLSA